MDVSAEDVVFSPHQEILNILPAVRLQVLGIPHGMVHEGEGPAHLLVLLERFFDVSSLLLADSLPLVVGQLLVPLPGWGIVVRSRVRHRVLDKVVRQVGVVGMTVESELQNASPRQLKLIA
jgi:hypothetical protein